MMIDAHQHVWRLDRGDYGWLTPALAPLWRDFDLDDLRPLLAGAGVAGTVLVQAAPTEAETRFLLDVAAASAGLVRGVVGWTDLAARDAPDRIAGLAADPLLRGLRPMIHDIPDPHWMLDPALGPGLRALVDQGLRFDALVRPPHLPVLRRLLDRHPDLPVVIDHGAKPCIAKGLMQPWADDIAGLARVTGAWCKLSGLATEAGPGWTRDRLRPYVDHLLDCFGPARLIWGSDWPVVDLAGGYTAWWSTTGDVLGELTPAERDAVLGGNAIAFYGLRRP